MQPINCLRVLPCCDLRPGQQLQDQGRGAGGEEGQGSHRAHPQDPGGPQGGRPRPAEEAGEVTEKGGDPPPPPPLPSLAFFLR